MNENSVEISLDLPLAPNCVIDKESTSKFDLQKAIEGIPDRMGFKIGDVADIVGVKTHVLRYWESEFPSVAPAKAKNNQRMYERKHVEQLLRIKQLLHVERYSIEGAKAALKKDKRSSFEKSKIKRTQTDMEEIILDMRELLGELDEAKALFQ